jgi:hypothetical protein
MKLTERKIETLTVENGSKDRLVFDDAQRGLAVRVTAGGGRNYLAQYTMHGQKWRVPLGACSAVSLAKAREAAAAIMGDVAKGRNPAAERKEAAAAERARRARNRLTLRVLIENWNVLHLAGKRPRYAAEAVVLCITRSPMRSTTPLRTWTGRPSCEPWRLRRGAAHARTWTAQASEGVPR